ncbi:GNAT family N-acetyltransferase [Pyrolobus fumarii]|uniref:GNAT family N-acetyltransferase n=1 Tax=Pyrolobus fumarii TaxID=54252 RepID=UPI00069211E7|nr:GNAT family N-acetyltransferase [Pyrolobus fumarii]
MTGRHCCEHLIVTELREEHLREAYIVEVESFERPYPWEYFRFIAALSSGYSLIAICNGKIAGFVMAVPYEGGLAHIANMAVTPEYRRCKVGSALLSSIEYLLENNGFSLVFLETWVSNHAARRFYEAHGYRAIRIIPGYYEWGEAAVVYVKLLRQGIIGRDVPVLSGSL